MRTVNEVIRGANNPLDSREGINLLKVDSQLASQGTPLTDHTDCSSEHWIVEESKQNRHTYIQYT